MPDESKRLVSATGGARIGWVNATWPLAKIAVSSSSLTIKSVQGTYDFLPNEVVALERYGSIPFFYSGIRIVHARADYPHKIIFWYLGSVGDLLEQIRETGFIPTAPASAEIKWRGIPVRWAAIVLFIALWNALFLPMTAFHKPSFSLGLLPLVVTFVICAAIRKSPHLQGLILQPGRSVAEIKAYLSLFQLVTGILAVIFAILIVAGVPG